MMVMTAKLNLKKILLLLTAAAAAVVSLILLLGGQDDAPQVSGNQARIQFLQEKGWEVSAEPCAASQVKIPARTSQVFERYNNLQKSQGYDLSTLAGEKVMRYVYPITNYPGAREPVYATLLVKDDRIVGGDITETGAGGKIRGLLKTPAAQVPQPESREPAPEDVREESLPESALNH